MNLKILTLMSSLVLLTGSFSLGTTPAYAILSTCVASIDSTQEVPPNESEALGSARMTFDSSTNQLTWDIEYSVDELSGPATAAHFHGPAISITNAGIQVDIGAVSGLDSPMNGSAVLTAEQADYLLEGKMYINIHTELNPGGEIRGEVACGVPPPPEEWQTIALVIGDEQFDVQYTISGGTMNGLTGNPEAKTITASITSNEEGELTIQLPTNLTNSVDGNGDGSNFMVWVDGAESLESDDDFGEDVRTLIIPFVADTEKIDIIGTSLIPEFSTISLFMTAAAFTIVGIVFALRGHGKFSFLPGN